MLGFIRETAHAHMCTSLAILSVCTGLVSVIIYHATAGRMLIRALVKFNVSNFLTTATSTGYLAAEGDRRFVCVLVWSQFIPTLVVASVSTLCQGR